MAIQPLLPSLKKKYPAFSFEKPDSLTKYSPVSTRPEPILPDLLSSASWFSPVSPVYAGMGPKHDIRSSFRNAFP
ncbi:hypothetical protein [Akkermansia sp. AKK6]